MCSCQCHYGCRNKSQGSQKKRDKGYNLRIYKGSTTKEEMFKTYLQCKKVGTQVITTVEPVEVDEGHFFASVKGEGAVIRLKTDLMGPIIVTQEAPDLYDTAYGVIDDLLTIHRKTI